MLNRKAPSKKLIREIFGEEEVRKMDRIENMDKIVGTINNYVQSMVYLVKEDLKDKKNIKLVEEIYKNENSKLPAEIAIVICEENNPKKRGCISYPVDLVLQEISFIEDADGTIDPRTSKLDYEIFDSKIKLFEKCDSLFSKHFLILTTLAEKIGGGDREGFMRILNNFLKKFKTISSEVRETNSNGMLSDKEFYGDGKDSVGFNEFLRKVL